MKPIEFEHNGEIHFGYAEKVNGILWLHIDGRTLCVKPEGDDYAASSGQEAADPGKIFSPMPGKIMKINVGSGQAVKKGQAVVTIEAMKMEYVLKAGADGKIKKLPCQEGQQVQLGQLLAELEVADV